VNGPAAPPQLGSRADLAHEAVFAVMDLEFTGLDPAVDRVCEVAIARVRGGVVLDRWSSLVRPGVPMSIPAIRITGLTDSQLADAPSFAEIADAIRDRLDGAVPVSHNVPSDWGFLQREFHRLDRPLPPAEPAIDTLLWSRRLFCFPRNNLTEVCERLGIPGPGHRASSDVEATAGVLGRILALLDPAHTQRVADLCDLVDALAPNSPLRLRHQQLVSDAQRNHRTLWIDYLSTTDPLAGAVRREVQVWSVKVPRFQAWCLLRGDERVFRLDRVTHATEGQSDFVVPDTFKRRV
jgi:DNA polymerase-3 subunit epsilon